MRVNVGDIELYVREEGAGRPLVLLHDSDIRTRVAQLRIQELIAEAERERLVRSAHRPRALLRVRALRLAARGLRVEREIDFYDRARPSRQVVGAGVAPATRRYRSPPRRCRRGSASAVARPS